MWPLWLWLPWFSAAQPRAAPHSTLPLVSPALQDPCTTTVSPAVPSPPSCIFGWRAAMSCWAGNAKVDGLYFSADTLMCSCCSVPGQCLFPGACLPCSKGFYQPLSGQQQCWPCNRGYYAKYTHCAHLVTGDSGVCFVCFTGITVLTVSLGVLYATPARLVPSTTTPEQRVARVARQVCLCISDNQNPSRLLYSPHVKICWGISRLLLSGFHSNHQSSTSCAPCALGSFCK